MARGNDNSLLGREVAGIRGEVVGGNGEIEVVADKGVADMDCAELELGLGGYASSGGRSLRRLPGGLSSARGEEMRERDEENEVGGGD